MLVLTFSLFQRALAALAVRQNETTQRKVDCLAAETAARDGALSRAIEGVHAEVRALRSEIRRCDGCRSKQVDEVDGEYGKRAVA